MALFTPRRREERRRRRIPDQVVRLGVIFGVGLVALLVVRERYTPKSFGELGHYRADAVDLVASKDLHYAGWRVCGDCHEEQFQAKLHSPHSPLSCEICHGPSYAHAVVDPIENTPPIPEGNEPCLSCHKYLPSRPTGFPQVIEFQHEPGELCTSCHQPHDPTPKEAPGECAACHRQIARTKAVSHHSLLKCETCHRASPMHRENPRASLPERPRTRAFCGQCHAKGVDTKTKILGVDLTRRRVPQIDLDDHGASYQCWQCHYPHFPEGRQSSDLAENE